MQHLKDTKKKPFNETVMKTYVNGSRKSWLWCNWFILCPSSFSESSDSFTHHDDEESKTKPGYENQVLLFFPTFKIQQHKPPTWHVTALCLKSNSYFKHPHTSFFMGVTKWAHLSFGAWSRLTITSLMIVLWLNKGIFSCFTNFTIWVALVDLGNSKQGKFWHSTRY